MSPANPQEKSRSSYVLLTFFLLLTATLSLIWSHVRLMWNDEFLSFYTDGVASFKQVVLVQLHHPISLDPPTYHLLSHLCMDIFGRNAMALRLPALAGFLLFQLCLFFFVRRLASSRAAVVAAALPILTASFRYSVEGRPYGLLLGLYALSLLCWQIATTDDAPQPTPAQRSLLDGMHAKPLAVRAGPRILPLTGLTLSIVLAITSHYFGVLILIPVSLGELSRILIRKRIDVGVLIALALGLASILLILPFKHALMVYRQHYYITGVNIHDISQGYRELFVQYGAWPMLLQKLTAALLAVFAVFLAVAGYRRFKRRPPTEHAYTWIALTSMALLPFFGYLFGRFVTHTMEVRYVIAALIAFAAISGIVLQRRLRSNAFFYATLAVITVAAVAINVHNIAQEHSDSTAILASLHPSPALAVALAANPTAPLYEQSLGNFFVDSFYTPNPALRARITLLYNAQRELFWLKHDTYSISAANLQHFTNLPTADYDTLLHQPGPHLLVQWQDGWNWTDKAAADAHAIVTPLGPSFGGQAVSVEWTQPRLSPAVTPTP
ncbi:MAG: glycosyltransferase family 39 protein [Acidobacteriaceae bacterium]